MIYAQAVLKFVKLNTAAQQRGAVVQGRSLPPIPAPVYSCYARDGKSWFCRRIINRLQGFICVGIPSLRLRPVRDDMLVENDRTNFPRPVGMLCW
ncbi:MAG: hypothetical protein LBK06_03345 [Planctomycetaceae bacterium]|nr:hypothetical protein [Planctomycetaceae bacterium]